MSTILVASQVLEKQLTEHDHIKTQAERPLTMIRQAVQQMTSLVHGILDQARYQKGKLQCDREPLDLLAELSRSLAAIAHLAAEREVELALDSELATGPYLGDAQRLQQVFTNLLDNAIKFSPRRGRVQVRVRRTDTGATEISVQDNGPGIPKQQLSQVFEAYWQAQPGSLNGTGLGLSIARDVVAAHAGTLRAESPPGSGARFVIVLP